MPQSAVKPVLRGVRTHERSNLLEARYYVVRFLTFLCDLTWAGTEGSTSTWAQAQEQIKNRYKQLYQLEAERFLAKD
jgi:hypothetical protein